MPYAMLSDSSPPTLAQYLQDPPGFTKDHTRRVIERLIKLGEKAAAKGDVPAAHDHFNRVLAMDEGNQRVLAQLEKLGSGARRRKVAVAAGIVLAVLGIGGVGYAVLNGPTEPLDGEGDPSVIGPIASSMVDAGRIGPEPRDSGTARNETMTLI